MILCNRICMQRVSKEAVQGLLSCNEGTVFFQNGLTMLSSSSKLNPFSNRMMKRSSIDTHVAPNVLEEWAEIAGLKLGPLIPSEGARHKVLCLLYHYAPWWERSEGPALYGSDHPQSTNSWRNKAGVESIPKAVAGSIRMMVAEVIQDGIEGASMSLLSRPMSVCPVGMPGRW